MDGLGLLGAISASTARVEYFGTLVVFGLAGYLLAVRMRRSKGVTPWHVPAITWAIVSALFIPPLGLLLEVVAWMTTRQRWSNSGARSRLSATTGFNRTPPGAGALDLPHVDAANPAGGYLPWPTQVELRPGPDGWLPAPPGATGAAALTTPPLFGWYPDPDAAHQERYWDGREWADLVRDDGQLTHAPLKPFAGKWTSAAPSTPGI
ncbi:MAG: DUF2510 domain-containing protein [Acidimicrobiales bacterium]